MTDRSRRLYLAGDRVDVVHRDETPHLFADVGIARAVVAALAAAGAPKPASVTVVLTDDSELADLNRAYMGLDVPTDVLSFPMLSPTAFQRRGERHLKWSAIKEIKSAGRPSGHGRIHIGDIAISVGRAIEQAREGRGGQTGDVRWSPADEIRLLVTHGTLHLCGWDHAEPGDEAAMRALEQRLLD